MLTSAPLAAWLADKTQQEAADQRTTAFARRWMRHSLFGDAMRAVRDRNDHTIDSLLEVARNFMARSGEIQQLLNELIEEAQADPFFRPPFAPLPTEISNGYLLLDAQQLAISVNVVSADSIAAKKAGQSRDGTVTFTGLVALYHYLKAGGATLSIWEAPMADGQFQADSGGKLKMVDRRRIEDGESWVMDGRHQSFTIEHATSDIVQLQAQIKLGSAPLTVNYDAETGAFASASAADEASSRTQMMVTLLRLMGRNDACPLIAKLVENSPFFTRWHLMRELLAMDAEAAMPHLRRMAAADPHPEVRAAASQTLEMFFPAVEEGGETCRA